MTCRFDYCPEKDQCGRGECRYPVEESRPPAVGAPVLWRVIVADVDLGSVCSVQIYTVPAYNGQHVEEAARLSLSNRPGSQLIGVISPTGVFYARDDSRTAEFGLLLT